MSVFWLVFPENTTQSKAKGSKETSVAINVKSCKLHVKGNNSNKKISNIDERINSLRYTNPKLKFLNKTQISHKSNYTEVLIS